MKSPLYLIFSIFAACYLGISGVVESKTKETVRNAEVLYSTIGSPQTSIHSRRNVPKKSQVTVPVGWQRIRECSAEFYLPPDFEAVPIRGIDSCVMKFRGPNTVLTLDVLGYYSPNASRKDEYDDAIDVIYRRTHVGGRRAEIITSFEVRTEPDLPSDVIGLDFSATLFVPQMHRDGGNLTMWANCRTTADRAEVLKIFQNVRFPKRDQN